MCISRFPSRLPKLMNSGRVHKTDSCGGLQRFRNSILWPFSKEGFRSRLLSWMQAFIMGSDFVPGVGGPRDRSATAILAKRSIVSQEVCQAQTSLVGSSSVVYLLLWTFSVVHSELTNRVLKEEILDGIC